MGGGHELYYGLIRCHGANHSYSFLVLRVMRCEQEVFTGERRWVRSQNTASCTTDIPGLRQYFQT